MSSIWFPDTFVMTRACKSFEAGETVPRLFVLFTTKTSRLMTQTILDEASRKESSVRAKALAGVGMGGDDEVFRWYNTLPGKNIVSSLTEYEVSGIVRSQAKTVSGFNSCSESAL